MIFNDALGFSDVVWFIIIGAALAFLILVLIIYCCWRKCMKKARQQGRREVLQNQRTTYQVMPPAMDVVMRNAVTAHPGTLVAFVNS